MQPYMAFLWSSVGSRRKHAIIKQEVPAVFHHSMTLIKGITEQNLAMKNERVSSDLL